MNKGNINLHIKSAILYCRNHYIIPGISYIIHTFNVKMSLANCSSRKGLVIISEQPQLKALFLSFSIELAVWAIMGKPGFIFF